MPRNGSDLTKFKKNDLLLAGFLALAAGLVWAVIAFSARSGSQVRVTVDGSLYGVYDLRENREIIISPSGIKAGDQGKAFQNTSQADLGDKEEITGDNSGHSSGTWYNVLQIKEGEVSITEADCPDLICVHHKPVSRQGETIVCLPHKLLVEVVGEDSVLPARYQDVSTEKNQDFDLVTK